LLSNLDINVRRKDKLEDEPDGLEQSTGIGRGLKTTNQQNIARKQSTLRKFFGGFLEKVQILDK